MYLLLILIGILVLFGIFEYRFHLQNLSSLRIRIHVNGTRGKSSVARLIAGALRAECPLHYGEKDATYTSGESNGSWN